LFKRTKHFGFILVKDLKILEKRVVKLNKKFKKGKITEEDYNKKLLHLDTLLHESRRSIGLHNKDSFDIGEEPMPPTIKEDYVMVKDYFKKKLSFKKKKKDQKGN
jgi:hypothetical protein